MLVDFNKIFFSYLSSNEYSDWVHQRFEIKLLDDK